MSKKRLKCFEITFEITSEDERLSLLDRFNSLPSKNEQGAMLASLLTVEKVKQRRPRDNDGASKLHDHSYTYSVKVTREGNSTTVPVCFNAFISIFGTTKAVVERIRKSLAETGVTAIWNATGTCALSTKKPRWRHQLTGWKNFEGHARNLRRSTLWQWSLTCSKM
ncbi:hypothetical protein RRG08_066701 [Elysia crispata]|uniref:Uncharacterized protein n=1 Tax=Elysia crispata TaxID=231223 RepID=A0AAE0XMA5_9GAST|nr:hypothetical protein RRG08_066701 [Elysia crispata]